MRPSIQLLAFVLAPQLALAQQAFLPTGANGNFPACAASCAVLESAQSTCLTQTGQQATGLAAENCFCQSGSLQGLYSTPDALCTAECPTESDRVNLRTWFMSFCAKVGQGVDPNAQTTSTQAATTVVTTSTNIPTATGATSGTTSQSSKSNQSWIQGHWQWIVMIIVLAIGLGALAWLLIFLRNRHRRKTEERRAQIGGFPTEREKAAGARAATPDLWGPHQHMHATKGWEYHEASGAAAAGAIPGARKERRGTHERSEKRRSHRRSFKPGSKTRDSMTEIHEDQSPAPRDHSSRGQRNPAETQRDPSHSRSRSRKPPRGSKYDFDRDIENL